MKKSYITESLIYVLIGVAAQIIFLGKIFGFIGGVIIIFLTSYFLMSKLKEQTIKEYLNIKQRTKNVKTR